MALLSTYTAKLNYYTRDITTPKRTVIKIGGMHCAGCVTAIQGYVSDLPGINKIEVNLANEKATLEYDESKIRLNTIEKAIQEVGYEVVYEKLALIIGGISDSSDTDTRAKPVASRGYQVSFSQLWYLPNEC